MCAGRHDGRILKINQQQRGRAMPHRFSFLPFMMIGMAGLVPSAKVNMTRIVEALIIAALTAGMVTWRTTAVLDAKLSALDQKYEKHEEYDKRSYAVIMSAIGVNAENINDVRDTLEEHILEQLKVERGIKKSLKNVLRVPWQTGGLYYAEPQQVSSCIRSYDDWYFGVIGQRNS